MGKATKAQGNPYYIARMAAAECNDNFASREGAADLLGIERTRLARIELDTVTPYPDEVRVMADLYNAPELMNYHCSHCCQIGRCMSNVLPASQVGSLEQLAVQAAIALRNSEKIRDDLLDISADGVIDENEQKILESVLAMLGRIAQVAHQLQAVARRLSAEEDKPYEGDI